MGPESSSATLGVLEHVANEQSPCCVSEQRAPPFGGQNEAAAYVPSKAEEPGSDSTETCPNPRCSSAPVAPPSPACPAAGDSPTMPGAPPGVMLHPPPLPAPPVPPAAFLPPACVPPSISSS